MKNNKKNSDSAEGIIDENSKMIRERVYLSPTVDRAFRRISEENDISRSAVIRILLASHLADYLSTICYVDTEQGQNIQELLSEVISLLSQVNFQVRKIGVNLNQVAKVLNKRNLYGLQNGHEEDYSSQLHGLEDVYSVVDLRELYNLITDIDKMVYELGGEIWRTHLSLR